MLKDKLKKTLSKDFTINDLEKIADEYALDFVNWIVEFQKIKGILFKKDFSTEELLSVFKQINDKI